MSKAIFKALLKAFKEGQNSIEAQAKKHAEFSKPKTPFNNIAFRAGNIPAAQYFKFQAFTTAVVQDEDIRNRIKTEIEKNLREGLSQRAFYKALEDTFKAAGLGEPKKLLQNVYATTTALAYGAGQQAKMIELKDTFPYWQYSAVMDSRTRPSHKALHGKIFKADDQYFHPPLGFRCRCTAIPLTARQAGKLPPEDFVQPAQHEAIKSELSNAEFIGNKQANYLRWVEQKYATASPEAKELIRKAASGLDNTLMTSLVPISPKMIETAVELVRKGYEVVKNKLFPYKKIFVDDQNKGYVSVHAARLAQSKKSKNEAAKFEKELRMSKVYGQHGFKIKMLKEKPGISSPDVTANGVPAELKSVSSHNHIVDYAKKAVEKQGAKMVLFEFKVMTEKIHQELNKLKPLRIKGYYYTLDDKNVKPF